jgi:gamma-glutamylcyclotransferase (GGCT)/AIG2-like uncharacterized protein YtfP
MADLLFSHLTGKSVRVHGEVYLIQHYAIKFVSDLRQVDGFLRVQHLTRIYDHSEINIFLFIYIITRILHEHSIMKFACLFYCT